MRCALRACTRNIESQLTIEVVKGVAAVRVLHRQPFIASRSELLCRTILNQRRAASRRMIEDLHYLVAVYIPYLVIASAGSNELP